MSGSKIRFEGVALDDQIALTTTDPNYQVVMAASISPTTIKKVAVILLNFQNNPTTPYSTTTARSYVFTNPTSANKYYSEASFGKWTLEGKLSQQGDVFGWVTVPFDSTTCNYNSWTSSARQLLAAQGVDLTGYTNTIYASPHASCGWLGLASVGSGFSYLNGSLSSISVITHELGHNFGLQHASSYSCSESGVRVPFSATCTANEYGDPFDTMGNISGAHMNAYSKGRPTTNYYDIGNSRTVAYPVNATTTTTYFITPIETPSVGIQSLQIPRGVTPTGLENYYVEFRQPSAFDRFATSSSVVNGVLIRLAPNYTAMNMSKLIDAGFTTTSFSDSALGVGGVFYDKLKGITIRTLTVSPAGATVEVTVSPTPCNRSAPSMTISPYSNSNYPGRSSSYTFTLRNNDEIACGPSLFSVTPTLPVGWFQTPVSFSESVSPQTLITRSFIVTSAGTTLPSTYTLQETASRTNPVSSVSASATYVVLPPDNTPPTISISKPASGSSFSKGKLQINASANDAAGISRMEIYLDSVLLKTCAASSCSTSQSASSLGVGPHSISVTATDASTQLNSASTTIAVIKN